MAVSYDPALAEVRLFVDGQQEVSNITLAQEGTYEDKTCGVTIGEHSEPPGITLPSETSRPWFFMGDSRGADLIPFSDHLPGYIDEIRFRTGIFTQQEAQEVYDSISPPPKKSH